MQQYMNVQTRIGAHNAEMDERDRKLRDARGSLVMRTGALVHIGDEDNNGSETSNQTSNDPA